MIIRRTYLIDVVIVIFIVSVYCQQALSSSDLSTEAWYRSTVEYIDSLEHFIQDSFDQKDINLFDYQPVQEVKTKLLSTDAPSEEELLVLLGSNRALDNKVAMVNVNLRNIYSKKVFNAMLGNINTKEQFFLKYFFYYALSDLHGDELKNHDDAILKTIKWEFDYNQLLIAMPALARIEDQKVIPLFVKFFKSSDPGFKKFVYYYLATEDKELLKSIKERLIEEKEIDAIEFIKKLEKDDSSNK